MSLKHLFSFLALSLIFLGCKNDKNKFLIVGEILEMPEQTILLEEMGINETKVLDSTKSDSKGHFELSGSGTEPGLYRLHFNDNHFILLSVANENIRVIGDWKNLEAYSVSGSPASESLRNFFGAVRQHINDIHTMTIVMDSMRMRGNDSLLAVANKKMSDINLQLTQYIEHYADTSKYLPNALFAVQILNPSVEKTFLDGFVTSLSTRFPNTTLAKEFTTRYNKGVGSEEGEGDEGLENGDSAPEITLNTPDGKSVSLSSFKGNYVLVDFWASWCRPCRLENPNVVSAYRVYRDKNFTILGVSLDNDKDKWTAAIAEDKLTWTQVSDLKGWESIAARDYNVSSIPTNFLIDPNGKIIARDLRGADLENILQQVLK